MMSQSASNIPERKQKNPPSSGLKLVNQAAKPTRIILDPEPSKSI